MPNKETGDLEIECLDCHVVFPFTAKEQKFYADRNYVPPKRCALCRLKRKQAKEANERQS